MTQIKMGVTQLISSIFIFILLFFFPSPCNSISSSMQINFTLYGDANFDEEDAITLTQEQQHNGYGRALSMYPIRFLDPLTNTSMSFYCQFSFTITTSPVHPCGHGLAFLITSNATSISHVNGHFGLPNTEIQFQESFFAVEFDTTLDPDLGDINDNHVGIDFSSVVSFVSVGVDNLGINLMNGREVTAWIQYEEKTKMLNVWVSNSPFKPEDPVLSINIDLSVKVFKEFMYIGFSSSNRREGSSRIVVESWQFKTFGLVSSVTDTETGWLVDEDGSSMYLHTRKPFSVQDGSLPTEDSQNIGKVAVGLGGVALLMIFMGMMALGIRKKTQHTLSRSVIPVGIPLAEIKSATKKFSASKRIGKGASAEVYKGTIDSKEVAVKRFIKDNKEQLDTPRNLFDRERAAMLVSVHNNIIKLLGWCDDGEELVLVYEYLDNRSLDKFLYDTSSGSTVPKYVNRAWAHKWDMPKYLSKAWPREWSVPQDLNWQLRREIVLSVASALTYLHKGCPTREVIHRDVKAANVLLDSDFNAKLGDFGLAEIYNPEQPISERPTVIKSGTAYFLAPELVSTETPTDKTDVYSFGVFLFEVVTGQHPARLSDLVWQRWQDRQLITMVDSKLRGSCVEREVKIWLMIGLCCVHPDCEQRPNMVEVEVMLRENRMTRALPLSKPALRFIAHPLPAIAEAILQG